MSAPPDPGAELLRAAARQAVHDLGNALVPLLFLLEAPLPTDPEQLEPLRLRLLRAAERVRGARDGLLAALDR